MSAEILDQLIRIHRGSDSVNVLRRILNPIEAN